jgi:hypothetical protein
MAPEARSHDDVHGRLTQILSGDCSPTGNRDRGARQMGRQQGGMPQRFVSEKVPSPPQRFAAAGMRQK